MGELNEGRRFVSFLFCFRSSYARIVNTLSLAVFRLSVETFKDRYPIQFIESTNYLNMRFLIFQNLNFHGQNKFWQS